MSNNQTVIANAALQLRNLFVNITDYPNFVRGQGGSGNVQYSAEVSSTTKDVDVELLLYKSETNYPNTEGHLIRVWYEIGFQIKAANDSADVIYKLQAKDKDGEWVDMCAAVTLTDVDTTWVTKLIKGFLDIQTGISKMPFEMRLIIQSNESSTPAFVSLTWEATGDLVGAGVVYGLTVFDGNLYAATGASGDVYVNDGDDTWTKQEVTATTMRKLAEFDGSLYAVSDGSVWKLTDGTWGTVATAPTTNAYCLLEFDGLLYVGFNNGTVYSFDGVTTWVNTNIDSNGKSIRCLGEFLGSLYAGDYEGCDIHKYNGVSAWTKMTMTAETTEVHCLTEFNGKFYAGTKSNADGKVFVSEDGITWAVVGGNCSGSAQVYSLCENAGVLYAGTNAQGDVFIFDEVAETWTNLANLANVTAVHDLASFNDKLYVATQYNGDVYVSVITTKHGEVTGRLKNDEASDGQKTKLEIVGRIV